MLSNENNKASDWIALPIRINGELVAKLEFNTEKISPEEMMADYAYGFVHHSADFDEAVDFMASVMKKVLMMVEDDVLEREYEDWSKMKNE